MDQHLALGACAPQIAPLGRTPPNHPSGTPPPLAKAPPPPPPLSEPTGGRGE